MCEHILKMFNLSICIYIPSMMQPLEPSRIQDHMQDLGKHKHDLRQINKDLRESPGPHQNNEDQGT